MSGYPVYVARTPDQQLAYPHWTDERWREPQLIYGRQCRTDECNYSDRLWQWDYSRAEAASKKCKEQELTPRTAKWEEAWLSAYHDKPVALRYILGGTNWSTGYEYYVYGYDYVEQTNEAAGAGG